MTQLVPLKDLKKDFSRHSRMAHEVGKVIQITKHNKPYLVITRAQAPAGLTIGSKVGKGWPTSATKTNTHGKWLKILEEDRNGNE